MGKQEVFLVQKGILLVHLGFCGGPFQGGVESRYEKSPFGLLGEARGVGGYQWTAAKKAPVNDGAFCEERKLEIES